ncbi:3-hydroxyisobutyryl-CoA hydrolase 1-like isoform X1 [Ricinus communis]|uniref:3-hydroxyisobutyryl-CoA hydrolase 1-like isoform X1 n=1 Tax=Ricinus communis TaxID=3988 RepID=UPI00201A2F43|nr:3-hydroxyisobutyryl-CoA hydrolase 1-like isoform X1 [Ricinus communis]
MDSHYKFNRELNQVLFEGESFFRKVILNRPDKLNSLNYEMISQMLKNLRDFEIDPSVKLVILKANGNAFSVGGDLVASFGFLTTGHWSFGARFVKKQLNLDYLIATYRKPVIPLIDGIVMGGGAGLSLHGKFRIVTEKAVFSMPEASIGHFPDVGASHFLSRLPGHFGEYLGLTGARLNGAEMLACGLATHFVESKDLPLLENALQALISSEEISINEVINKFSQQPRIKEDNIYNRLDMVDRYFSKDTVEEILHALEEEAKNKAENWIIMAMKSMKSASPTSLKITLRSIIEGRMQTLKQYFCKPKWEPSKLELVSKEMVDHCFAGIDDDDWKYLKLPCSRSNRLEELLKPKL